MKKYRVMDFSYGNLRMVDRKNETIVMEREVLEEIINKQKLKEVKEKAHKYPHLFLDIEKKNR